MCVCVCVRPGYVEDGVMSRLYRQAPLNAIWEGSGNVICLDVLRCLHREPESVLAPTRLVCVACACMPVLFVVP